MHVGFNLLRKLKLHVSKASVAAGLDLGPDRLLMLSMSLIVQLRDQRV